MPYRLLNNPHVAEFTGSFIAGSVAAMTWILSAISGDQTSADAEIRATFPGLVGALIGSSGMFAFNPNHENKKVTYGRGIFALLFGAAAPAVLPLWGMFEGLVSHPILQVMIGAGVSFVVFAVSKPLAEKVFSNSNRIAAAVVEEGIRMARIERKEDVKEAVREVADEGENKAKTLVKEAVKEVVIEKKL